MRWFIVCLLISFVFELCVAPGVGRDSKEKLDTYYNIDNLSPSDAQDREFDRYLVKVLRIIKRDPAFMKRYQALENSLEEDYGKLVDGLMMLLNSDSREKLNQLKKDEVAHQEQNIAQNKMHMAGIERNEWNPIHHVDKETFRQVDFAKLLTRFVDRKALQDEKRRQNFRTYEMTKELEHREKMKIGTKEEQAEEAERYKHHHEKKHEKMHAPMNKAQMEDVWEDQDGLDKEAFDHKTLFNMHDMNSDGYLDEGELETFFVRDLDKVYNESDPDTDPKEREEELERMREMAMVADKNKDNMISQKEYLKAMEDNNFERDEEWIPLTEKKQFSEEELEDFRSELEKEGTKKNS